MSPPIFPLSDHMSQRERINDPMLKHVHSLAVLVAEEQQAEAALRAARARIELFIGTIPEDLSEHLEQCRLAMRGEK